MIGLNKRRWDVPAIKKGKHGDLDPALMEWKGSVLFYDGREVVMGEKRRQKILQELYESPDTPYGINKLQRIVAAKYIGVTQKHLREFLHSHEQWQLRYPTRKGAKDKSYLLASKPGFLELDYTFRDSESRGLNNNRNYILTCIDRFSRHAWVIARQDKTAKGTTAAFERVAKDFKKKTGKYPHTVFHDNGKEFDNKVFREFLHRGDVRIRQLMTEAYRPAVVVERFNRTLRDSIDTYLHMYKSQRYIDYIPRFTKSYNTNVHRSTGQAPLDLLTDKTLWAAAVKRQKAAGEKRVRKSAATLTVGDRVRLSLRKGKDTIGHAGPKSQWSKKIYTVESVIKSRGAPRYRLKGFPHLIYSDRL